MNYTAKGDEKMNNIIWNQWMRFLQGICVGVIISIAFSII